MIQMRMKMAIPDNDQFRPTLVTFALPAITSHRTDGVIWRNGSSHLIDKDGVADYPDTDSDDDKSG